MLSHILSQPALTHFTSLIFYSPTRRLPFLNLPHTFPPPSLCSFCPYTLKPFCQLCLSKSSLGTILFINLVLTPLTTNDLSSFQQALCTALRAPHHLYYSSIGYFTHSTENLNSVRSNLPWLIASSTVTEYLLCVALSARNFIPGRCYFLHFTNNKPNLRENKEFA